MPISRTNRRKGRFEYYHGPGAAELDALAALHPGEIARLLSQALDCYCSLELSEQVRLEAQKTVQQLSQRLSECLGGGIPVLGTCCEPKQTPAREATGPWLYDSTRDYLSQLQAYKSYSTCDTRSLGRDANIGGCGAPEPALNNVTFPQPIAPARGPNRFGRTKTLEKASDADNLDLDLLQEALK